MKEKDSKKWKGKYRIDSTRLRGWDYSYDGAYFITICTKNRQHFFGEIRNGKLIQTKQSQICMTCWLDLPNHYPNCILDAFVIMPNHVHAVIFIDNSAIDTDTAPVETGLKPVSTRKPVSTPVPKPPGTHDKTARAKTNRNRKKYSLSEIVRGFKTFTARKINEYQNTQGQPFWQTRFHDRIIRDENELNRIREYIQNNPRNWKEDRNNF